MKNLIICFLVLCTLSFAHAQTEKWVISAGLKRGYSDKIGAEIEYLLSPNIGIEVGAGSKGYGLGLHIHFEKHVRSSSFKLFYGKHPHKQFLADPRHIGMAFNYRGFRGLTAHVGFAYSLTEGTRFFNRAIVTNGQRVFFPFGIGFYRVIEFKRNDKKL